jgi:hypothetical protein
MIDFEIALELLPINCDADSKPPEKPLVNLSAYQLSCEKFRNFKYK